MVSVGGNQTLGVGLVAVSTDGARVILQTTAALIGADTDEQSDVYERFGGVTKLVSVGPTGGNAAAYSAFEGASADATRVFFRTVEKLVEGDTDNAVDVYERIGGLTTLISIGPAGGSRSGAHASALGFSEAGDRVFFVTPEQLVAADGDGALDIYERSGGGTTLISGPAAGSGSADIATYSGNSADGTRVFFRTQEALVPADGDEAFDVYERAGGVTTLISTGPAGGNGGQPAFFAGAGADGSRVFFETDESLVAADTDPARDVYVSGSKPRKTPGPDPEGPGTAPPSEPPAPAPDAGPPPAASASRRRSSAPASATSSRGPASAT